MAKQADQQTEILLDEIEHLLARWEDGGGGTYRDLAERIVHLVRSQVGDRNPVV